MRRRTTLILSLALFARTGCSGDDDLAASCGSRGLTVSASQSGSLGG